MMILNAKKGDKKSKNKKYNDNKINDNLDILI
jgi:hypothetical protein